MTAKHSANDTACGRPVTPDRARGFTYIELLVVLAILSIVAAEVVPRLGTSDPSKLSAAASLLVADIAYAQVESIVHADNPRYLVLNSTNNGYSIVTSTATTTPITNPATMQPYSVTYGSGSFGQFASVTVSAHSLGGGTQLQFGMYGQTTNQTVASTITLNSGARTLTISIDPNTGEASAGAVN